MAEESGREREEGARECDRRARGESGRARTRERARLLSGPHTRRCMCELPPAALTRRQDCTHSCCLRGCAFLGSDTDCLPVYGDAVQQRPGGPPVRAANLLALLCQGVMSASRLRKRPRRDSLALHTNLALCALPTAGNAASSGRRSAAAAAGNDAPHARRHAPATNGWAASAARVRSAASLLELAGEVLRHFFYWLLCACAQCHAAEFPTSAQMRAHSKRDALSVGLVRGSRSDVRVCTFLVGYRVCVCAVNAVVSL